MMLRTSLVILIGVHSAGCVAPVREFKGPQRGDRTAESSQRIVPSAMAPDPSHLRQISRPLLAAASAEPLLLFEAGDSLRSDQVDRVKLRLRKLRERGAEPGSTYQIRVSRIDKGILLRSLKVWLQVQSGNGPTTSTLMAKVEEAVDTTDVRAMVKGILSERPRNGYLMWPLIAHATWGRWRDVSSFLDQWNPPRTATGAYGSAWDEIDVTDLVMPLFVEQRPALLWVREGRDMKDVVWHWGGADDNEFAPHLLVVRRDENSRRSADPDIRVAPKKLGAALLVKVSTANCEVEVDGKLIGIPAANEDLRVELSPGTHKLQISGAGWRTWTREIVIEEGVVVPVRVEMVPE